MAAECCVTKLVSKYSMANKCRVKYVIADLREVSD